MSSIDRLIKLAKKTGDRLIIHDPVEGNDVVIMDIDSYEMLMDTQIDLFESLVDEHEPEMFGDESELPEDYPVEEYEEEVDAKREDLVQAIHALDKLMDEERAEEPETFEEAIVVPEFETPQSAPEALPVEDEEDNSIVDNSEYIPTDETIQPPASPLPKNWSPTSDVLKNRFPGMNISKNDAPEPPVQSQAVTVEDLPFDVPFKAEDNIGELDEERLDDDPVFLEEPV
jgi:hypothetical protein